MPRWHKSTMLCHFGNIAYRTESTLKCEPKTGHILNNKQAMDTPWDREYPNGLGAQDLTSSRICGHCAGHIPGN